MFKFSLNHLLQGLDSHYHLAIFSDICFWLWGSQQTVENSSRDVNTRPSYLPPEKSACRSRSNREPDMDQQTGSKLGKAVYCHPAYLTYMQSTSCKTPGWMKQKLESRLQGEILITSDMQMTPPYGRKQRGTEEPLDESERGEWKSWLKPQHSEN